MILCFQHLGLIGQPKNVTSLTLPVHLVHPRIQHAAPRCGLSSVCICPRVPQPRITGSLPPSPPAHHASAPPPPAARCAPPDCANESDASSLLSLLATQQRATALAPTSAASQLVHNASLSTAHPFLAQQKPLHHTLSCTPSSGPAFNIFSRLALPLSSQQSLSSFTPADPPEACRRRRKKNTFPAGRQPSK